MNQLEFSTLGDWDTTTLYNDGVEVLASRLYVEMHAGQSYDDGPARGGIPSGGECTAYINPQEDQSQETPIFPGRLSLSMPSHNVVIENVSPQFDFEATRVWFDSKEVTDNLVDLLVDINAVDNEVNAYIVLYRPHWLSSDEVATYTLIG